jgi:tRNA/rRNA methyltransferase
MTGRDGGADLHPIGNSPVVILVRPQLADNVGACARAMANGGLFHMRLVAPRDGWPQEKAWRMACTMSLPPVPARATSSNPS